MYKVRSNRIAKLISLIAAGINAVSWVFLYFIRCKYCNVAVRLKSWDSVK